jgi:trimeric autotransporter adhesin
VLNYRVLIRLIFFHKRASLLKTKPMLKKLLLSSAFLLVACMLLNAQLKYSFTNVVSSTEAYTDIAPTGTPIAMTSNTAGTTVSPQNIGFDFVFNGTTFTQFTLHADGIIRMGTANPGAATSISSSNATTYFSAFTTTSASYQNIIMPFFTDLIAGTSTPQFHVLTTGTAPNRVCTIQFKNLKDSSVTSGVITPHFSNIAFQAHLYETTNDIKYSYDNFVPTTTSLAGRFACIGVKASSTAFVNLQKRSFHTWDKAIPFGTNITGEISGFSFRNNVPIANGFMYHLYAQRNTDVSVAGFFADAEIPKGTPVGNQIQAIIKNEGVNAVSAIPVTLTVTGANSFTETINIASLAPGTQQTVVFTPFAAANTG